MTSYTDNRRYPYPSSEREAGNGGAASEALARAVEADLVALKASWAMQATRPVKILGLSSNITGISNGSRQSLSFSSILDVARTEYFTSSTSEIRVNLDGWYYCSLNCRAAPSGTVTVNARLENWLNHYRNSNSGTLVHVEPSGERFGDTYWPSATADCFNRVSGMFRMLAGDRIWPDIRHSNTGSTVNVVAAGTYLTLTRMCGI